MSAYAKGDGWGCLIVIVIASVSVPFVIFKIDSRIKDRINQREQQQVIFVASQKAELEEYFKGGVKVFEIRQTMHEHHHKTGTTRSWTTVAMVMSISHPAKSG